MYYSVDYSYLLNLHCCIGIHFCVLTHWRHIVFVSSHNSSNSTFKRVTDRGRVCVIIAKYSGRVGGGGGGVRVTNLIYLIFCLFNFNINQSSNHKHCRPLGNNRAGPPDIAPTPPAHIAEIPDLPVHYPFRLSREHIAL